VDFGQIVVVFEAILSSYFKGVDGDGFALNESPVFEQGNKMAKDLTKSEGILLAEISNGLIVRWSTF